MNIYTIVIAFFILTLIASAQKEANNWYFGDHAGITFQNGKAEAYGGGQISSVEGCATISDKTTGALLFYTDGVTIWNRNDQIMTNGNGLKGAKSSSQSALIVPNPANSLQYYIFTTPEVNRQTGFHYSLVSLENPNGEVILKNIFLIDSVAEKVTGTIDCEGTGYWVVTHHATKGVFYSFHVTTLGVDTTPIITSYFNGYENFYQGYIKISPNKSKIAVASSTRIPSYNIRLSLFDFNASTGEIANYMPISTPNTFVYYGVSFSPDNSKLYISGSTTAIPSLESYSIFQYETDLPDAASIRASLQVIKTGYFVTLQLASNGKIYAAELNTASVGILHNPNRKGLKSNYQKSGLLLTGTCQSGLPNFMDYNLGHSSDTAIICSGFGSNSRIGPPTFSGYSYSWSPATGLDNPSIANPIASPSQTTEYTLKVTNTNGCESFQTYIVAIAEKPKIAAVAPICAGASVQLSASGGDTYQWFPPESVDTATKANPIAKPKVSTRYKVITTRGQCTDSAFVDVEVIVPVANAGADKTTCTGGSVQLGDTAKAGESYTWTPTEGLNNSILSNPIATPTKTTQYILEVWKNGCTAYDTVLVTVVGKTKAIVSGDTAICGGQKVQLMASGGSNYSWTPTVGLDNPSVSNPIASPQITTKYKVIVSNGDCKDSAFVTVSVSPFSGAKAGIDKTICPGASTQIGTPPETGNTYLWSDNIAVNERSLSNPTVSPNTTTEYILTVTNATGCIATDTVLVTVGIIVAKVSNDTAICSGSSIQLLASGGANYTWTPTTGLSNPSIENPTATPTTTTTYKVKVSSGTCEDSAFVTITVNPQPIAKAGEDKTLCIGASTEIGEAAQTGFTYSWLPTTGLDDATKSNPTASPTSTTQYILTVTGNGGCSASDTVLVTIGTIKAFVSNDTSICEGASAKLFASGGSKYEWSPSTGLDNPSIATPTANPTSTTKYKVLVSSGTCIDSNFVTVTILPPPNANAGNDKPICRGESTQIGISAEAGNAYSWSPSTGLSSPTASQTTASPATTTTYTLTVSNAAGCVKSDEVTVTVNPRNERSFTLKPDTVSILPGKQFTTYLNIPSGVVDWSIKLNYDPLLLTFNSISEGQAIPEDLKGELLVSGNGGSRSISINFDAYLPHTSDTVYPVRLVVDSSKVADCETWNATGNILMLADYCGKNIRVVSSTGKKYYLTVKDRSIDFGVGLSGNVRLEVFDYVGNSVLVVSDGALEAGEYSAALDLPVGVYYCRIQAGMYESVGKVLIAR
ncbi:MAG: hypothetical protein IPM69_00280 [Ignavibacteria bacterium]|nr:hypothetical protein [Ignavibacteria bacterium]